MADPEGFEPSIPLRVYSLSRGALSTTQPQVLRKGRAYKHANILVSTQSKRILGEYLKFFEMGVV